MVLLLHGWAALGALWAGSGMAASALHLGGEAETRMRRVGSLRAVPEVPEVRKIFYINLAESTDRRAFMEQSLATWASGVPYERWPAVPKGAVGPDGHLVDMVPADRIASYLSMDNASLARLPGVLACYASHVLLLRHIRDAGAADPDGLHLVLEDDVNITGEWRAEMARHWPAVPSNWDVLRLGYFGSTWPCDEVSKGVFTVRLPGSASRLAGCAKNYMGTQAYVVSPRRAAKVLDYLAGREVRDIDTLLCTGLLCAGARDAPGLQVYALADMRKHFLEVDSFNSIIGKDGRRNNTRCEEFLLSKMGHGLDCLYLQNKGGRRPRLKRARLT